MPTLRIKVPLTPASKVPRTAMKPALLLKERDMLASGMLLRKRDMVASDMMLLRKRDLLTIGDEWGAQDYGLQVR